MIPILELRNPEKGLALKTTKRLHLSLLLESTEDVFLFPAGAGIVVKKHHVMN